jgi:hypothetical protein
MGIICEAERRENVSPLRSSKKLMPVIHFFDDGFRAGARILQ